MSATVHTQNAKRMGLTERREEGRIRYMYGVVRYKCHASSFATCGGVVHRTRRAIITGHEQLLLYVTVLLLLYSYGLMVHALPGTVQ